MSEPSKEARELVCRWIVQERTGRVGSLGTRHQQLVDLIQAALDAAEKKGREGTKLASIEAIQTARGLLREGAEVDHVMAYLDEGVMHDLRAPYPHNPGSTHYDGCWANRGHHNCATELIRSLSKDSSL